MDTDELIAALAADKRRPAVSLTSAWRAATGLAVILAAAIFYVMLGPRPDIAAVAGTPRFLFKFLAAIILAASAFGLVSGLSRPGERRRKSAHYLAAAPILVVVAVLLELVLEPADAWPAGPIGANGLSCLAYVVLIGVGPLAIFLVVLRHGAPTRPAVAGAVAGLLAGGISAALYAVHCPDDSPLFVAIWYSIAIAGLALVGAAIAFRFVRW